MFYQKMDLFEQFFKKVEAKLCYHNFIAQGQQKDYETNIGGQNDLPLIEWTLVIFGSFSFDFLDSPNEYNI